MELTELVNWLLIWREKGDSGILFGALSEQWYTEPRAATIAVIMDWGTPYVQCVCVCVCALACGCVSDMGGLCDFRGSSELDTGIEI